MPKLLYLKKPPFAPPRWWNSLSESEKLNAWARRLNRELIDYGEEPLEEDEEENEVRVPVRTRTPDDIDDWMDRNKNEYIHNLSMSMGEVALYWGVSSKTAGRWLDDLGLPVGMSTERCYLHGPRIPFYTDHEVYKKGDRRSINVFAVREWLEMCIPLGSSSVVGVLSEKMSPKMKDAHLRYLRRYGHLIGISGYLPPYVRFVLRWNERARLGLVSCRLELPPGYEDYERRDEKPETAESVSHGENYGSDQGRQEWLDKGSSCKSVHSTSELTLLHFQVE